MSRPHLVGYSDEWSVVPGQEVSVMLDASEELSVELDLVRLGHDADVDTGARETLVRTLGTARVRPQQTSIGSCIRVADLDAIPAETTLVVAASVMATRPRRPQVIFGQGSWTVGLDDEGRPLARVVDAETVYEARAPAPLVAGAWYLIAAGTSEDGLLRVVAVPLAFGPSWRTASSRDIVRTEGSTEGPPLTMVPGLPLFIAARSDGAEGWTDCFDGKLEGPTFHTTSMKDRLVDSLLNGELRDAEVIWDLGVGTDPPRTIGTTVRGHTREGRTLKGEVLNSPTRAVTGVLWSGGEQDVRLAPEEFAAIHFHSDDLDDCRWERTRTVSVPRDIASGVYAVRARSRNLIDHLPLFVRPRKPTATTVLVLPTASYLAYANDHPVSDGDLCEAVAGRTPVILSTDLQLHEHREWGLSCYDLHGDGSGVVHSSRRRPTLNLRPGHRYHVGPWQLPADLALLSWLGDEGIDVDVVTDEDIERDGAATLSGYRVVITGTHPEYTTTRMLNVFESWIEAGGRLVYIGANGFYWRAAFDPAQPWVLEVRRGQAGSRASESASGEAHLQATGELGGLWRHLGRTPQRTFGVGYAAQGFDRCGWYERLEDSDDPRAGFIFDGITARSFGQRGSIGGGAAGQELDRYDAALGSPSDALLLATSAGLSEGYHRCVDEIGFTVAGTTPRYDSRVRGDVVYHVRPSGGAVFATGSIAWAGSLGVDNGITTITRNVVRRFTDPAPLDW